MKCVFWIFQSFSVKLQFSFSRVFGLKNPNTLELQGVWIDQSKYPGERKLYFAISQNFYVRLYIKKNISIFNKRNSPLTKLECISNEQRMFTLKNPNLIPRAKGYSNPNPSGLRPSRIWIGMGPWPLGYTVAFSVAIIWLVSTLFGY